MALDPTLLAQIRDLVGEAVPPTDADLEAYYLRTGTVNGAALVVLERRYIEMASNPSIAVAGGYSESWGSQLKALADRLAELRAAEDGTSVGEATMTAGYLVREGRTR